MISNYCTEMANKKNISASGVKKVLPKLSNKNKHVFHY